MTGHKSSAVAGTPRSGALDIYIYIYRERERERERKREKERKM